MLAFCGHLVSNAGRMQRKLCRTISGIPVLATERYAQNLPPEPKGGMCDRGLRVEGPFSVSPEFGKELMFRYYLQAGEKVLDG